MNKKMIIWLVLFLGLSSQAFAKAGIADGGFEFMLAIVGFLLLMTGLFAGIEYLMKNGKNLFNRFKAILIKKIFIHRNSV
jgi:hypothetical protein